MNEIDFILTDRQTEHDKKKCISIEYIFSNARPKERKRSLRTHLPFIHLYISDNFKLFIYTQYLALHLSLTS